MLEDVLIEEIFTTRPKIGELLRKSICVALMVLGLYIAIIIPIYGLIIFFITFILVRFLWQTTNVEYEYSYLNGELSIDKIYNQVKRKKWTVLDLKSAELIAPANHPDFKRAMNNNEIIDYSSGFETEDELTGVVIRTGRGAQVILLRENKRIIEAMRRIKPMIVKYDQEI